MPIFVAYHLLSSVLIYHNVTIDSIILQKCSTNMYERKRIRIDRLLKQ